MSRVLVVEDEAHLAQGLRFNLEAEGYSAEVVGDGEAATDRLLGKRENFDVIVLDIMLPGKDGFSVVSELRAAQNYVPVLMLTARGSPEDVLKGFAAGADDYLSKPFALSILLARLQGLLRHLVRSDGRVVSRKEILEEVWGLHEDTDTRAIDNFMVRLRRYIEDDPAQPRHLLTVRGVGYRFVAQPGKK